MQNFYAEYSLKNAEEVTNKIWACLKIKKTMLLKGNMGVGKTSLVQLLCKHKNTIQKVTSPTYSIVNEYEYLSSNNERKNIFHLDLYRLKTEDEVFEIGITDILKSQSVCLIEWPKLANSFLIEGDFFTAEIKIIDEHNRSIWIENF